MKRITYSIILTFIFSISGYPQAKTDINVIILENQYERYIYNPIITLKRSGNEVLMYIEPCEYHRKKKDIKKCKTQQPYKVEPKKFDELVGFIKTFDKIDAVRSELKISYLDGYSYTVRYGDNIPVNSVTYRLPDVNTSGRGLDNFLKACKMINKLAGFKL